MTETNTGATDACPRYVIKQCPNDEKALAWLNKMAEEGYHFLSMEAVSSTEHFTKEIQSVVWIVMERLRAA